jgi:hypothetical protein
MISDQFCPKRARRRETIDGGNAENTIMSGHGRSARVLAAA